MYCGYSNWGLFMDLKCLVCFPHLLWPTTETEALTFDWFLSKVVISFFSYYTRKPLGMSSSKQSICNNPYVQTVLLSDDPITLFNPNLIAGTRRFRNLECYWLFFLQSIKLFLSMQEVITNTNTGFDLFFPAHWSHWKPDSCLSWVCQATGRKGTNWKSSEWASVSAAGENHFT